MHNDFNEGGISVIESHLIALINLLAFYLRDELLGFVQIGSSDEYGISSAPKMKNSKNFLFLHILMQNLQQPSYKIP